MASDKSTSIKLGAEIGTEMTIELPGKKARVKLRLIGILKGEFLIFHVPQKLLESEYSSSLNEGVALNIRSISRGSVFGFKTIIIQTLNLSKSILFTSFPKMIQNQTIRKDHRVKCLLPARLLREDNTLSGTVADISRGGCHYQAKKAFFTLDKIKSFQTDHEVIFALSLPGIESEIQLTAAIVNVVMDDEKVQIGLAFLDGDEEILKQIDSIIDMSFDISPL